MARVSGAQSSLGGSEERLRRALRLAGLIEAGFNPEIRPFVLVDDATRPGCNIISGRNFAFGSDFAIGVALSAVAFKAVNEVIIDWISVGTFEAALPYVDAGSEFQLLVQHSSVVDPFAIATLSTGSFTEILGSNADAPPLLQSALGQAVAFAPAREIVGAVIDSGQNFQCETRIHLRPGDKFAFQVTPTAAAAVLFGKIAFRGRTF